MVSEGRSHRSAACVATHLRKVAGLFFSIGFKSQFMAPALFLSLRLCKDPSNIHEGFLLYNPSPNFNIRHLSRFAPPSKSFCVLLATAGGRKKRQSCLDKCRLCGVSRLNCSVQLLDASFGVFHPRMRWSRLAWRFARQRINQKKKRKGENLARCSQLSVGVQFPAKADALLDPPRIWTNKVKQGRNTTSLGTSTPAQ